MRGGEVTRTVSENDFRSGWLAAASAPGYSSAPFTKGGLLFRGRAAGGRSTGSSKTFPLRTQITAVAVRLGKAAWRGTSSGWRPIRTRAAAAAAPSCWVSIARAVAARLYLTGGSGVKRVAVHCALLGEVKLTVKAGQDGTTVMADKCKGQLRVPNTPSDPFYIILGGECQGAGCSAMWGQLQTSPLPGYRRQGSGAVEIELLGVAPRPAAPKL